MHPMAMSTAVGGQVPMETIRERDDVSLAPFSSDFQSWTGTFCVRNFASGSYPSISELVLDKSLPEGGDETGHELCFNSERGFYSVSTVLCYPGSIMLTDTGNRCRWMGIW